MLHFAGLKAVGESVSVFGSDYDTPDGTGVRDYIHVVELAQGHVKAIEKLAQAPDCFAVNLGTGEGCSVLDMVRAFEKASGREVPYTLVDRRPGDIASCCANPGHAKQFLNWRAARGIDEMCADQWRWQTNSIEH